MSKLVFTNDTSAIDFALENWLKKYGFEDVCIIGLRPDFGYFPHNCGIAYSLLCTKEIDDSWEALMVELGCPYKLDIFYTSFLHELGHDQTLHLLTNREIKVSEMKTHQIMNSNSLNEFDANMKYYYLPREIIATKWAIDFISDNAAAVKELVDTTWPAIQQFISKLRVDA